MCSFLQAVVWCVRTQYEGAYCLQMLLLDIARASRRLRCYFLLVLGLAGAFFFG